MGVNPTTGQFRMLETTYLTDAQAMLRPDEVLVQASEDEIRRMSDRIRLGNRELQNRAARRKQQRESRRRNRT